MTIPNEWAKFDAALVGAALVFLTTSMPAPAAQEPRPPAERRNEHRAVPPAPNRWLDNAHGHSRYYPRSSSPICRRFARPS